MKRIVRSLPLPFALAAVLTSGSLPLAAAEKSDFEAQPIFTRYAKVSDRITLSSTFRAFRDVELQEAENFDGWGVGIEATVPFLERFQLHLSLPLYTTGEARLVEEPHENLDLEGNGGALEFPSFLLEWQFLRQEKHGFNMTVGAGAGSRFAYLETSIDDVYNHAGKNLLFELRADRKLNEWLTLAGHLGVRHYYDSDDINPAGEEDGDIFTHVDAFAAGVFNPWNNRVFPVLELAYTGDFSHYNSVTVVPEVIWSINKHFELKGAFTVGLTSDGERVGARVQAVVRF